MEGVPFEDIEKHKLRRDEESGRKKVKVETDPEVVREQFKKYQASIEGKVVAGPTVRVEVSDGISTPSYQSSSGMPVVGPSGIPVMATPGMPVVGPAVIPIPGLPVIPGITAIPGIPPLNIPGLPPGMMPPGPPPGLPGMPPPPTFMPPGVHLDTTSPPIHLPGMPVPPTFNPPSESLVKILNVIKVTRPFGKYQDGVVLVYGDEERSVEERRAEIFGYSQ